MPVATVAEYWDGHLRNALRHLEVAPKPGLPMMVAQVDHGRTGWVDVEAVFPNGSRLVIFEYIVISDGARRRSYIYHFMPSDDRATVRFHYAPDTYTGPLERHIDRHDGSKEPDTRRTLPSIIAMCWLIDGDPTLSGDDIP